MGIKNISIISDYNFGYIEDGNLKVKFSILQLTHPKRSNLEKTKKTLNPSGGTGGGEERYRPQAGGKAI